MIFLLLLYPSYHCWPVSGSIAIRCQPKLCSALSPTASPIYCFLPPSSVPRFLLIIPLLKKETQRSETYIHWLAGGSSLRLPCCCCCYCCSPSLHLFLSLTLFFLFFLFYFFNLFRLFLCLSLCRCLFDFIWFPPCIIPSFVPPHSHTHTHAPSHPHPHLQLHLHQQPHPHIFLLLLCFISLPLLLSRSVASPA